MRVSSGACHWVIGSAYLSTLIGVCGLCYIHAFIASDEFSIRFGSEKFGG